MVSKAHSSICEYNIFMSMGTEIKALTANQQCQHQKHLIRCAQKALSFNALGPSQELTEGCGTVQRRLFRA